MPIASNNRSKFETIPQVLFRQTYDYKIFKSLAARQIVSKRFKSFQRLNERKALPHVIRRQIGDMKRGLRGLEREGFRYVHILDGSEEIEIKRAPLWNNKKDQTGPFDIFGDLHGCADELRVLIEQTGWERFALPDPDTAWGDECWRHSVGRRAIFLGDLVDRGPHVLDTVRIVRNMVAAGTAFCVAGNRDVKFMRWLRGKQVQIAGCVRVRINACSVRMKAGQTVQARRIKESASTRRVDISTSLCADTVVCFA